MNGSVLLASAKNCSLPQLGFDLAGCSRIRVSGMRRFQQYLFGKTDFERPFFESSMYPAAWERPSKQQYAETPPFSRNRQHDVEVNRLIVTSSARRRELGPNASLGAVPTQSATVRAVLDVDIEYPLQPSRPAHAPLRAPDRRVCAIACERRCGRSRHRYHRLSQLRVRCQHPMKTDRMQTPGLVPPQATMRQADAKSRSRRIGRPDPRRSTCASG